VLTETVFTTRTELVVQSQTHRIISFLPVSPSILYSSGTGTEKENRCGDVDQDWDLEGDRTGMGKGRDGKGRDGTVQYGTARRDMTRVGTARDGTALYVDVSRFDPTVSIST
jgi:hypothetical protein